MVMERGLQYLEALQNNRPELATRINQFGDLYQRKLWHQLTVAIEESLALPEFRTAALLIPFYNEFVATFAHKLNPLRLAHIAVTVAEQFSDLNEAGVCACRCPTPCRDIFFISSRCMCIACATCRASAPLMIWEVVAVAFMSSWMMKNPDVDTCAVSFLEGVIKEMLEAKLPRTEQPLLFLRMHVAQQQLLLGQLGPCKAAVETGKVTLDNLHDVGSFLCWHSRVV